MPRQLLLGIAASVALGAATLLASAPAKAQSWSVTVGSGGHGFGSAGGYGDHGYRPVRDGWDGGWRERRWDRGHGYGHGGGYGFQGGPRCVVRKVRYWDGWGWVVDRRRVCH